MLGLASESKDHMNPGFPKREARALRAGSVRGFNGPRCILYSIALLVWRFV